ncbi:aspartate aminotransferase family protein [Aliihoeflea sp. PC F10.4]
MDENPNSPEARDIRNHLHSFTNARRHLEVGPLVIERGSGIYVEDNSGKRYIEAMAGLWSVAVGFSEPRLVEAAARQMQKLPYYHTFYHRSHSPVIELAEKLVKMAPAPMSKAFFASSGSEANDTVIKMIWYRSNAMGQPQRKKIISRQRAYHGVTLGAASLTGLPVVHKSFDLPLPNILHVSCPYAYRNALPGESEETFATRLATELEDTILREGPDTVAAFIGEPIIGAGGVITPPATYWEKIQAVLARYDILLVADEIICGFGRTGAMFGSDTYGIRPDILVASKQLSSSYMPISAVLVNDKVFEPIAAESDQIGAFAHGLTASGHPVAAAVALENLAIIEERGLVENARHVGKHLQERLLGLESHPLVGQARGSGLIGAVELVVDKATKEPWGEAGKLGAAVVARLLEKGVIARSMGDIIGFSPPLIITRDEVDVVIDALADALSETEKDVRKSV